MNLKKLFATTLTVLMVATLFPVNALKAGYSSELEGAYDYAFSKGSTTMNSIEESNVYGQLIRSHMAKMLSAWATEVLGLTPDTSATCEFTDIENQTQEMQDFILESCQLGLMGQNISEFRPNDKVTRAEFGTVLSRALRGDKYNGGTPYYADHLAALNDEGVMNDVSNPSMNEVRGYVRLMMQRADEKGVATPATCKDPMVAIACALNPEDDACPVECRDVVEDEELAGTLDVSLNSDSLDNGTQIPKVGMTRFAVVNFEANSDDVSLKTISIKKVGLASIPSTTRVWFEKNGIRISGKAAFTSDGTAILSFAPTYVVKANSTEELDFYVDLNTTAGQDFQFKSTDVGSTAENLNGGFTTPTLRTADYVVNDVKIEQASGTGTANVTENGMELGAFKITANSVYTGAEIRDLAFQSVTFRQDGNASLDNISDVVLERNGIVVSSNPTINGRDITFTVEDTIKNATTATYYIKAIVNDVETSSDVYQFTLRNTSDLNVIEENTSFRSPVVGTPTLYSNTIQGSDISFTRDTNTSLATNYAAGSDIVLMKGTITTKSAITLEDPTLVVSSSSTQTTGLDAMFSTVYLQIGNSVFSYSPTATDTGAYFLGSATIDGTANVKMYAKLKDTSPARTLKFNDMQLSTFRIKEYVSNGYTVATSIGSIAGVSVTSQTATLNVTRNDALGNTSIAAGSNGLLVYGLNLSSNQGNGVTISNMVLTAAGWTTGFLNNVFLTLYINGTAIQTKTVTSTTVTFDGFSKTITPTTSMNIQVKANMAEAFSTGTIQLTLSSLNAYDTLTSNGITSYSKPAGAVFTVATAAGTLAASSNNPLNQYLLSPSTSKKIAAFKVTAANDNVRLYDVALRTNIVLSSTGVYLSGLTGANIDGLSNFRLIDASENVIATATTITSTGVTFTSINNAPVITKDQSANYFVIADVNSSTNSSLISTVVLTGGTNIKSSNGTTIAIGGSNVTSNTHAISENVATFAAAANPSKLITTSALRFTVTGIGKNNVTLTGVSITASLAGYTGTMVVNVYKGSTVAGNLAGTAALTNGVSQIIPMTSNSSLNSVVDAGSTVEYIIVVAGALVDPSSNSQDRSVSLTNANYLGILAATYDNLGAFPFTSTK